MNSITSGAQDATGDGPAEALSLNGHNSYSQLSTRVNLSEDHVHELVELSGIDPKIVIERCYETIEWNSRDTDGQQRLKKLSMPTWSRNSDKGNGLLIPVYRPTGEQITYQWKPIKPVRNREGKYVKYTCPRGQANRLDVHPRNSSSIRDVSVQLWITEGIKKADSLTSRGLCVVALTGVYNWRNRLGTLGDWEDVPLKGRKIVLCFDADAHTNPNVLNAMRRLGRWLKSKGVKSVHYLIVPNEVAGVQVKGVDDFFVAGGTLDELLAAATTTEPGVVRTDDTFTDARMAETLADEVLDGKYVWCKGLGWMGWTGQRWESTTDESVGESVRQFVIGRFEDAVVALRSGKTANTASVDGWRGMLSAGRQRNVLLLCRGIVERKAGQFDADPDLLNTPTGIVDLTTGEIIEHDPDLLITKITKGSYRPGYTHPDWEAALEALPDESREWYQNRVGQGISGNTTPDGVLPILQGSGENGKSLLTTDGLLPALGDYASVASPKLIMAQKGSEHSTEMADLRGKRFIVAEEMTEGRALDITVIKRIQDVGRIKARYVHRDNIEFIASHTLFATTNYIPIVAETDHGTWRRLALLKFPYTFRKSNEELTSPTDRRGDPDLKVRVKLGKDGQHDAIVTWAVEGSIRYANEGSSALAIPKVVAQDTLEWRATADRILGFWLERLMPDKDAMVLASELLGEFNDWLTEDGHKAFSNQSFVAKFEDHSETKRHLVNRGKELNPATKGLVRRSGLAGVAKEAVPTRPWVWRGVRYRSASDLRE